MKPQTKTNIRKLHDLRQRIWLDNIAREMPNDGTLARYIAELSVTGLMSNSTIFEHAIGSGDLYDAAIQKLAAQGRQALGRLEPRRVKARYPLPLDLMVLQPPSEHPHGLADHEFNALFTTDAIRRVPRLAGRVEAETARIDATVQRHKRHIGEHGDDMPEILNWRWPL